MKSRDLLTSRSQRKSAAVVPPADSYPMELVVRSEAMQAGLEALAFLERSSVLAEESIDPVSAPEVAIRGKSK